MDEHTADNMVNDRMSGSADTWPLSARDAAAILCLSNYPGPDFVLVETGTLTVRGEGLVLIDQLTGTLTSRVPGATEGEQTLTLSPGDALMLPIQPAEIRNDGQAPTLALAFALFPTADRMPSPRTLQTENWTTPPDQLLALAMYPQAGEGGGTAPPGIDVQPLSGGIVDGWPERVAVIAVGLAALAPGESIPAHGVANVELVAVQSGTLSLTTAGESALIRRGAIADERPASDVNIRLLPGDAACLDRGTTDTLWNASETPAVALVVTANIA